MNIEELRKELIENADPEKMERIGETAKSASYEKNKEKIEKNNKTIEEMKTEMLKISAENEKLKREFEQVKMERKKETNTSSMIGETSHILTPGVARGRK